MPSSWTGRVPFSRGTRTLALFALIAASRIFFLAAGPCEWDSFLFAQGVERFDLAEQRPHPPGYPVLIVLARVVRLAAGDPTASLALLSAALGTLAFFPLARVMRLFLPGGLGTAAAVLVLMSPAHWMTSERALSDAPGFFFAILALDLALRRRLRWAAFAAGIAAGVRPQGLLVLAPLAIACARERLLANCPAPQPLRRPAAIFAITVALWLVPTVQVTGGLLPFLDVLGRHGENFLRDDSLLVHFTTAKLAGYLGGATIAPWGPRALAWPIVALALRALFTRREKLWPETPPPLGLPHALAAFLPYYLFLVFFMLAILVRYSIFATPLFALLAVRGAVGLARPIAGHRADAIALGAVVLGIAAEIAWTVPPLVMLHRSLPPSETLARFLFDRTSPAGATLWYDPFLGAPFRDRLRDWDLRRVGARDEGAGDEKPDVLLASVGEDLANPPLACFEWTDRRLLKIVQVETVKACVAGYAARIGYGFRPIERDRQTGEVWRWMGPRGSIRVRGEAPGTLWLRGGLPVELIPKPGQEKDDGWPILRIETCGHEPASVRLPGARFDIAIEVPARPCLDGDGWSDIDLVAQATFEPKVLPPEDKDASRELSLWLCQAAWAAGERPSPPRFSASCGPSQPWARME